MRKLVHSRITGGRSDEIENACWREDNLVVDEPRRRSALVRLPPPPPPLLGTTTMIDVKMFVQFGAASFGFGFGFTLDAVLLVFCRVQ
jgi:hypothetical protein